MILMAPHANEIVVGFVRTVAPLPLITNDTESMHVLQKERFELEPSNHVSSSSSNRISIDGFNSSDRLVEQIAENSPDVLITESNLSSQDDINLLKRLRTCSKSLKILLIVKRYKSSIIEKGRELGVNGYLHCSYNEAAFKKAIHSLNNGIFYVCPKLRSQFQLNCKNPFDNLTKREKEVVKLSVAGISASEIGEELSVSMNTIKSHRRRIYLKLGLKNLKELLTLADFAGNP